MRKLSVVAIALMILLCAACLAHAQDTNALELLARPYVPADAVYLSRQMDDGQYELNYRVQDTGERYEVTISGNGLYVVKVSSEIPDDRGSKNVTLTEAEAVARLMTYYPGATVEKTLLEKDDGRYEYQLFFSGSGFYGKASLHPETGVLLEREIYYEASAAAAENGLISAERAKGIALAKAGGGQVVFFELDRDDGRQVYEIEIITDQYEYEFEIDAKTGNILEWDREKRGR